MSAIRCYQCARIWSPLERPVAVSSDCQSPYPPPDSTSVECSELDYSEMSLKSDKIAIGKPTSSNVTVTSDLLNEFYYACTLLDHYGEYTDENGLGDTLRTCLRSTKKINDGSYRGKLDDLLGNTTDNGLLDLLQALSTVAIGNVTDVRGYICNQDNCNFSNQLISGFWVVTALQLALFKCFSN
ncbi:hypothetical protein Ocin01_20041 [Orchesella cincta]|uniref:Uncharacterized protein n=1 Tax=Orchesella cincta TaxID=48709 RepID=A0A1D2M146_ORCCI|nr:hypothetical protein Ocin01_20041 [Orchesella cincta]